MVALKSQELQAEPEDRIGVGALTRQAFTGDNIDEIATNLLIASMKSDDNAGILMDLSVIEQIKGNTDAGLNYQRNALIKKNLYRTEANRGRKLKLLVLAAPIHMGGNTPIEMLLENANVEIMTIYIAPGLPIPENIPDHDMVMIAAPGDTGSIVAVMPGIQPKDYLHEIESFLDGSTVPVINRAEPIFQMERDVLPDTLENIEGVRVPKTIRCNLEMLTPSVLEEGPVKGSTESIDFPFVIRPVGSHAGFGFELINSATSLRAYLSKYRFPEYFVSELIDYTSEDGEFRKYRIMFVDGKAYPCHMAIGKAWKLWYMNAEMDKSSLKRIEEASFMKNFNEGFGKDHRDGLQSIARRIDLDYFGIDCAVDREGNLIVFEADNTMIVHDMDPADIYPYKSPAMKKLFKAFEKMLFTRSKRSKIMGTPIEGSKWVRIQ